MVASSLDIASRLQINREKVDCCGKVLTPIYGDGRIGRRYLIVDRSSILLIINRILASIRIRILIQDYIGSALFTVVRLVKFRQVIADEDRISELFQEVGSAC